MASGQEQIKKTDISREKETAVSGKSLTERGEKLKKDIDRLVEEIDEVLEENAEEFVKNYVQRGGE